MAIFNSYVKLPEGKWLFPIVVYPMLSPDPSISPLYHLWLLNPRWIRLIWRPSSEARSL